MPLLAGVRSETAMLGSFAEAHLDPAAPEIHQRAEDAGLIEEVAGVAYLESEFE
jgi:hypothetical protein